MGNAKRGGLSGFMEKRYIISVIHSRIFDLDSINVNGINMSQSLPYAEEEIDKGVSLGQTLTIAEYSENWYVFKVDSK